MKTYNIYNNRTIKGCFDSSFIFLDNSVGKIIPDDAIQAIVSEMPFEGYDLTLKWDMSSPSCERYAVNGDKFNCVWFCGKELKKEFEGRVPTIMYIKFF